MHEPTVVDAPADALKAVVAERRAQVYTSTLLTHMAEGTMPYSMFKKLPTSTRNFYKAKFKGHAGHERGRPLSILELQARARKAYKGKQVRRAAKQARKRNR